MLRLRLPAPASLPADYTNRQIKPKLLHHIPARATLCPMDEARFTALIRKHLPFYLALADGRRTPTTPAQRHFAAARGETAAQTEHEHAFALWRQRTTHVAHTLDAQAARTALIPDARTRAAARLSLKPTPPPRKP